MVPEILIQSRVSGVHSTQRIHLATKAQGRRPTCYLLQFMVGQLRFILSVLRIGSRKHAKVRSI